MESEVVWDLEGLLRTLRGNRALALQLADGLLQQEAAVLAEIRAALTGGDAAGLEAVAHRLKGNAGMLRAQDLSRAARCLEELGAGPPLPAQHVCLGDLERAFGRLRKTVAAVARETTSSRPPSAGVE